AVRTERGEEEAEESWDRIYVPLSAAERAVADEALLLAGKVLGTLPPRAQRLEALYQEFLSEYPDPAEERAEARERSDADGASSPAGGVGGARAAAAGPSGWTPPRSRGFTSWPVENWLEAAKEGLESETRCWEALGVLDPVVAPRAGEDQQPRALDMELQRLMGMRRRWDELLGHLGLLVKLFGLWRELGFASFSHYCAEWLWLSPRTVEQRVWLERRCYHLPGLREAMRAGRLTYEQARLVANQATPETLEEWVGKAEKTTCIGLRRAILKEEDRQMSARQGLTLMVPTRVSDLMAAAFRAAQKKVGRPLTPGQCLVEICRHFIEVWKGTVNERSTPERKARRRDEHCTVPGCSRVAAQGHHIIHVSQGGPDDPWNITGVCGAHHFAIHQGWVRVSGRAPDQLVWELGELEEPAFDFHWPGAAA
ncbi:MAG TPA: HNH endonuclease signature motif containing protein, partial [Anaeromyxobacteraceae bacterium]|nr:HNH endonuclease signature motif containing protein [Anaeromyxobacteraceae bacterium]